MKQFEPILNASALIFDVDGTLVDSVDFHAESWVKTFAAFGFDADVEDVRSQIGKGGDELMPVFLPADVVEGKGKDMEQFRKELFAKEYMGRLQGFRDVPDLFRFLIDNDIVLALGSSAKSEELQTYKKVAGIEGLTAVETTSDDAKRSKPHPDIFSVALERVGQPAEKVVVVGDTPYDVEAASKAGMRSIGFLCGGFPEAELREAGAVKIYRNAEHLLRILKKSDR